MIWFMVKVIAALFVIAIFVSFIADAAHSISSDVESLKQAFKRNSKDESNTPMPSIQYKRYTEEEAEYLQGIWQGQPLTEKNRFRIIYDFLYSGNKYFLLGRDYGNLYLRRYTAEEAGEDTICILEDVKESIASELKKEGRFLDSWLKDNFGKGTKDTYINFKDEPNRGVVLNTYPQRKYVIQNNQHDAERTRQTEKHDLFCSDEWWEEQQRFINDSLYINHDWEIFKDEGERK